MTNEAYIKICKAIETASRGSQEADVVTFAIGAFGAAVGRYIETNADDGSKLAESASLIGSGVGGGLGVLFSAYQMCTAKKSLAQSPNPYYVLNGHCDDDPNSPVTYRYVMARSLKGMASIGLTVAGAAASASTGGVDTVSAAMHLNATGSTLAHVMKLRAIAKQTRQSRTISNWLEVVFAMKAGKTAVRGSQAVVSLIPGGCLTVGVIASLAAAGIRVGMSTVCYRTAAELHWRAFLEGRIAGFKGLSAGGGPAERIITELFTRRGVTRVFGQYDIKAIINEPCGWMAVADKIMLM